MFEDFDYKSFAYICAAGLTSDIVFVSYIFPCILFIQLLFSKETREKFCFVDFSAVWFFALISFFSLNMLVEIIFWKEYGTRYNFLALDYIFRPEYFVTYISPYYIFIILSAVLIVAGFATKSIMPILKERCFKIKTLNNCALILIFIACGYTIDLKSILNIYETPRLQSIAKNGLYELAQNIKNGDKIDYTNLYPTNPDIEKANNYKITQIHQSFSPALSKANHMNVVLLIVESLNHSFITQAMTPNLFALKNNSMDFTNLYATSTRTAKSIDSMISGLPSAPGMSKISSQFDLSKNLAKYGYRKFFAYGGYNYFDHFKEYFIHHGYEVLDRSDFSADEISFANIWGVSDEDLFLKSTKYLDNFASEKQNFFSIILTTSTHFPYSIPTNKISENNLDAKLLSIKYTDYAIGEFFNLARTKSWFNNTIFVITADHTMEAMNNEIIEVEKYHIPFFIYAPNIIKPIKNNYLASQIDILPTILSMIRLKSSNDKLEEHSESQHSHYGMNLLQYNPQRAFISTYQQLGYIKEDAYSKKDVAILSPQKQITIINSQKNINNPVILNLKSNDLNSLTTTNQLLAREAISIFQHSFELRQNK